MFDTRTRLLFFACLKDAAGAALKNAAPAPGSDQKKIGSGAALKVAAPAPQHCFPVPIVLRDTVQWSQVAKNVSSQFLLFLEIQYNGHRWLNMFLPSSYCF